MQLKAKKENQKQRLDVFLAEKIEQLSRSSVEKLCDENKVLVNGKTQKTSYKLKGGDKIEVDYDPKQAETIPKIDLPIIYEDDDCLVVDKPAGILTHSKGAFNPEATVATFIADKIKDMDGDRAGIVHRLDRATSGVIICAKHPGALQKLQAEFSKRNVKKTYYALIEGDLEPAEATIDIPIGRNPKDPKTFYATVHGKPAQTTYRVIGVGDKYSLVELQPKTGRTHQLRVHLRHMKQPILGDKIYGGEKADRMYLHAARIEITLPNRQRKVFESPLPAEFDAKLKA